MAYGFDNGKNQVLVYDKAQLDALLNSLYHKAGDTFTASVRAAGYISNSSTSLGFFVPTKPIIGSSVTVNSVSLTLRSIEGIYPYFYQEIGSAGIYHRMGSGLVSLSIGDEVTINASIEDGGVSIALNVVTEGTSKAGFFTDDMGTEKIKNNTPLGVQATINITVH